MRSRITVKVPEQLLENLDHVASLHLQNRSETILEALNEYVRKG